MCLLATLFVDQKVIASSTNFANLTESQLDAILKKAKVPEKN